MCGSDLESEQAAKLDHSHATGQVRGYLCTGCNSALGWIEREGMVAAAHAYLRSVGDEIGARRLLTEAKIIAAHHAAGDVGTGR